MITNVMGLLEKMTPDEQAEAGILAAFVLARRKLRKTEVLTDDIQTTELIKRIEDAGCFDWLNSNDEDVYSIEDGEEVEWASVS